ncbi:MAG: transposase [Acidiferrobacter sp.]
MSVWRVCHKAVDRVRRREHRERQAQGIGMLTKTRYRGLKNPLNGTECPRERFQTRTVDALKGGRTWAIQEAFSDFWDYRYTELPTSSLTAGFWATHSRHPPIVVCAKTLKRHLPGRPATAKHRSPTPPQKA